MMTMLVLSPGQPLHSIDGRAPSSLGTFVARQPLLSGVGIVLFALTLPTFAALLVETRTLNGINVWAKPLKFQASLGLYLLTLAWFWGYLPETTRRARRLEAFAGLVAAVALLEVAYISLQAGRGVPSHFNDSTLWEEVAYNLMGVGSLVLTGASLVLGLAVWRRGGAGLDPAFRLALILGLLLTFALGMASGVAIALNEAHWVGGAGTDTGGLPIVGWSRTGGDLRVAHFFGLHALQILPMIGWLASRAAPSRTAAAVVGASAAAVAALTFFALTQALAGRPFLAGLL